MNDLIQKLKIRYQQGEINIRLIFICVGIYFASIVFNFLFAKLLHLAPIQNYFVAKATWGQFLSQAWGIVTYTFFHGGLLHLTLNCLMIYFIGQLFLRYFRKENFLTFFLFGSISGALAFMAFSGVFKYGNSLLGASAAVYSIFFAMVAYIPKNKIRLLFLNFDIQFIHIAYGLLGFDLLMIMSGDNIGGHVSHLGGAAFGFLYMKKFEKGNDFLGGFIRSIFFRPKQLKTRREHTRQTPPRDDYEFNAQRHAKQKKVDEILDKIARSGYESLTKEEKDFLFKAGRNG